jgi:three-Cys-motif partner protein
MDVPDDGWFCAKWKPHTRDKLCTLGYYLEEFTGAMAGRFPNLVYVDLFAGPGRGRFPSGLIMEGSPLIAARTSPPFTKLIFVEASAQRFTALRKRLTTEFPRRDFSFIVENCNSAADRILTEIPPYSKTSGVLTFCFVDPFGLDIHFSTIRRFQDLWVDFLVLVADQMAGARDKTLLKPANKVVERFLDDDNWRNRWASAKKGGMKFKDFLLDGLTSKMKSIGFKAGTPMRVNVQGMGVMLYRLAFFSKREVAIRFWENARTNAPTQKQLEF